MNSKQESKLNMYHAVQKHCNDNSVIINSVKAVHLAFAAFEAKISSIVSTAQQQDMVIKGISLDKSDAKRKLAASAANIGSLVFAYASNTGNNTLKQQVNFPVSILERSKDDELGPRCLNIHKAATDNLPALGDYGITAAQLASLQSAIDNYMNVVPTPRNATATKSTLTKNMNTLLKEADKLLKEQLDRTISGLKETEPDFYNTYKNNRIILDPGKTATQLSGVVTTLTSLKPISNVKVVLLELGKETTTNAAGEYNLKPVPQGEYTIEFSVDGYKTSTVKSFNVKLGHITRLDQKLQTA